MSEQSIEDEVREVLAGLDPEPEQNQDEEPPQTQTDITPGSPAQEEEPLETYHIYPVEGIEGFIITKTPLEEEEPEVVPSIPATPPLLAPTITKERIIAGIALAVVLAVVFFDIGQTLYLSFFQTATITIRAREQIITATQTIGLVTGLPTSADQLQAHSLDTITLTQRATAQATGTYHQNPTYAVGYVTFYNGQFSSVSVPAGTGLSGSNGISIVTTQDALIPGVDQSANPPALGQTTIAARATLIGSAGNIPAYTISRSCCAQSVLVKNTQAFTGGQDAKTYAIVTQSDLDRLEGPLKTALVQSVQGALGSQAKPGESVLLDPCSPTLTPNHQSGDQATQVTVSGTLTCGGLAYNQAALQAEVSAMLTKQAQSSLGNGYSLIGTINQTTTQVIRAKGTAALLVEATGVWGYFPSQEEQQSLKRRIAGKPIAEAQQLLQSQPGIEHASVSGLLTNALPTDTGRIRFLFIEVAA